MNKCVSSTGGEIAVEVTLRLFAELVRVRLFGSIASPSVVKAAVVVDW